MTTKVMLGVIVGFCVGAIAASTASSAGLVYPQPILLEDPLDYESLVGDPFIGEKTIYLVWEPGTYWPLQEFEFSFVSSFELVSLTPAAGVVNEGTLTDPRLAVGFGCTAGVLAEVVIRDPTGAGGCIVTFDNSETGRHCFRCDSGPWVFAPAAFYQTTPTCDLGLRASGPDCVAPPVSVDGATWGRVKATYR